MRLSSLNIITLICLFVSLASCSEEAPPVGKMPPIMKLGEKAPDFAFKRLFDSSNIEQRLSQYQGKVIYLDFWASWCKPCLKSMPLLSELRTELANQGFEVIAVNLDSDVDKGVEFIMDRAISYPTVRSSNDGISQLYQIAGLPTGYLIDRDGVTRYAHQGFKEKDIEEIKKQVLLLLN